ncbi:hypothetical protein Dsin_005277 [Dipteronia sinensis]|uniref:Uncharacterized protein n=1 Tax=Dipteronia sinensis TaxID=43782 RepID=A0AAE0EGC5_9ROSI|nr:hypothetical protein Dsin_005277 [Dipteronia sinensis]
MNHTLRKKNSWFNGAEENGDKPRIISGKEVRLACAKVENDFGKKRKNGKRKKNRNPIWKNKSIFFDLPYWQELCLRHNLDVMHIEKNICESLIGTLLNINGKTKDASLTKLEDDCIVSMDKEIDQSHQKDTSLIATNLNLMTKIMSLEEQKDEALKEVKEKDDLIKTQVDEFVETSHRFMCETNDIMKRFNEVERLIFEHKEIVSIIKVREQEYIEKINIAKQAIKHLVNGSINMKNIMDLAQPQGGSSILKGVEKLMIAPPPSRKANNKKIKKFPTNNLSKAKGERKDKALVVDKHDASKMHDRKNWMKKLDGYENLDKACVASNDKEISINDILMNQIVKNLHSRFNIKVKIDHDDFCIGIAFARLTLKNKQESREKIVELDAKVKSLEEIISLS